jgi:hypothetical protein
MASSKENLGLEGHNASPQVGVDVNPDSALDYGHEHRHPHTHHHGAAAASKEKTDDVMYTTGTTEKAHDLMDTPAQDYTTHKLQDQAFEKSMDEESGNVGNIHDEAETRTPRSRYSVYYRKFRPFIPIVVWLVFTA